MNKKVYQPFLLLICLLLFLTSFDRHQWMPFVVLANESVITAPTTLEELNQMNPKDVAQLEKFNSVDYGIVTPVKNQNRYSLCWAFSAMAAAETNILKNQIGNANVSTLNLDERNLAYVCFNRNVDKLNNTYGDSNYLTVQNSWDKGAFTRRAAEAMLQEMAPVNHINYDNYNYATGDLSIFENFYDPAYRLKNYITIPRNIQSIKEAIAKYGAVTITFSTMKSEYGYEIPTYYNITKGQTSSSHACVIVGWDDTISKSFFRPSIPNQNGAWIVKNSWGTGYHKNGYFYLSYDNTEKDISSTVAFEMTDKDSYDHLYFYNGEMLESDNGNSFTSHDGLPKKFAAIYEAKCSTEDTQEYLTEVNVSLTGNDVDCHVEIYIGLTPNYSNSEAVQSPIGDVLHEQINKKFATSGVYSIPLENPLPLNNGESFSIVVQVSNPGNTASINYSIESSKNDMTYMYNNEEERWENARQRALNRVGTAYLRAYTKDVLRTTKIENDIAFAKVSLEQLEYTYDGTEKTPGVIVKYNDMTLFEDVDYTLEYQNNLNALQNTKVIITGINQFHGTKSVAFRINQAQEPPNRPKETIEVGLEITRLGQIPLPDGWYWMNPNFALDVPYIDFEYAYEWMIEYRQNRENYLRYEFGLKVLRHNYNMQKLSADQFEISFKDDQRQYVYNGKDIQPEVIVKYNDYILTQNQDYTVEYQNNRNAGNASIIITGLKPYEGSQTLHFMIAKADHPYFDESLIEKEITISNETKYLFDILLPKNWKWQNKNQVLTPGIMNVVCEYVGEDASNYQYLTQTIQLKVIQKEEEIPDPDTPEEDPNKDKEENENTTQFHFTYQYLFLLPLPFYVKIILIIIWMNVEK